MSRWLFNIVMPFGLGSLGMGVFSLFLGFAPGNEECIVPGIIFLIIGIILCPIIIKDCMDDLRKYNDEHPSDKKTIVDCWLES